ncbi:MAG TPA: DinB family protein [Gemmatimonadales bacterium]|nr:DinB family protein [Gemmatimonadales bacterium]
MTSVDLLMRTIAPKGGRAWHGGVTPVGAVRGVSAKQAFWRPAPRVHSIWELTLHIAYWKYAIRRHVDPTTAPGFPRSPSNWPSPPARPDDGAWAADRLLLKSEHEAFAEALRRFSEARLDRRPPSVRRWSYGDLIAGVLAHDAYHTGQIQLIKRLWQRG